VLQQWWRGPSPVVNKRARVCAECVCMQSIPRHMQYERCGCEILGCWGKGGSRGEGASAEHLQAMDQHTRQLLNNCVHLVHLECKCWCTWCTWCWCTWCTWCTWLGALGALGALGLVHLVHLVHLAWCTWCWCTWCTWSANASAPESKVVLCALQHHQSLRPSESVTESVTPSDPTRVCSVICNTSICIPTGAAHLLVA